jgi:hypothetical protein
MPCARSFMPPEVISSGLSVGLPSRLWNWISGFTIEAVELDQWVYHRGCGIGSVGLPSRPTTEYCEFCV